MSGNWQLARSAVFRFLSSSFRLLASDFAPLSWPESLTPNP
jgi:hypothetical protein